MGHMGRRYFSWLHLSVTLIRGDQASSCNGSSDSRYSSHLTSCLYLTWPHTIQVRSSNSTLTTMATGMIRRLRRAGRATPKGTTKDVNYVYRAVPVGLINDMPKLKDALQSPEKALWIKAIE